MELKSLDQLIQLDPMLQVLLWGNAPVDQVVLDLQHQVSDVTLSPGVPEPLRLHLEVCQRLIIYGAFVYDFFTVAAQRAYLGYEYALGVFFLDRHDYQVPLWNKQTDERKRLIVTTYQELCDALASPTTVPYPKGSHAAKHGWRIDTQPPLDLSMTGLFRWARAVGALPPRFSTPLRDLEGKETGARRQDAVVALRNLIAHPTAPLRITPGDSVRAVRDLTEFINHLWGLPRTP